jgi:hypothetical protein
VVGGDDDEPTRGEVGHLVQALSPESGRAVDEQLFHFFHVESRTVPRSEMKTPKKPKKRKKMKAYHDGVGTVGAVHGEITEALAGLDGALRVGDAVPVAVGEELADI